MSAPTIFPGETTFSYTARLILRSGVRSARPVVERMGVSRASAWSPLGLGLRGLYDVFPEIATLVSPEDLVWRHTTSPLLAAFSNKYAGPSGRAAFCAGVLDSGAWFGGGRTCRCLRPVGLRECPICREEDVHTQGVAYWHREHQIRPVLRCWRHDIALLEHVWRPTLGFPFELPGFARYATLPPPVQVPSTNSDLDLAIAKGFADVLSAENPITDPRAREVLVAAAKEAGWFRGSIPGIRKAHVWIVEALGAPYLEALGYGTRYSPKRGARLARPLIHRNKALDPAWVILLAAALGLPHDAFRVERSPAQPVFPPPLDLPPAIQDERLRIEKALQKCDFVLSRAAESLGISWSVLTTLIARHGIVCPIVASPNANFDKGAIEAMIAAKKTGLSWVKLKHMFGCKDHQLGTLKIYDPELTRQAAMARRQAVIEKHRCKVQRTIDAHPEFSRAQLRKQLVSETSFLAEHDKAWLDSQWAQVPRRKAVWKAATRDPLDDQVIDAAILEALHKASAKAFLVEPPRRITRSLLIRMGGLANSVHARMTSDRLPRSCAYLASQEEARENFFSRRIRYALGVLGSRGRTVTLIAIRRASGLSEPCIVENKEIVRGLVAASRLPVSLNAVSWLRLGRGVAGAA